MNTINEQSPLVKTNPLLPLAGKKGLITGVANDKSIAFAVAKAIRELSMGTPARRSARPKAAMLSANLPVLASPSCMKRHRLTVSWQLRGPINQ